MILTTYLSKNMNPFLKNYCDFVSTLASEQSMEDFDSKLGTSGLGITGEAGEIADTIKKIMYQGKIFDEKTREDLIKETGDLLWYVAFMCRNVLDVSIEEVIEKNIEKLQNRYKSGKFTIEEFKEKEKHQSS